MASSPDSGPEANFEIDLDEMDREMEREETHGFDEAAALWDGAPIPGWCLQPVYEPLQQEQKPWRERLRELGAEEQGRMGLHHRQPLSHRPRPTLPNSPYSLPSRRQSSPHHPTSSTTTSSPGAGRRRPSTNSPSPGQSWVERRRAKRREAEMEGREVVREAEQPRQHLERKEQARKGVEVKRTKERSEKESVVQAKRRRCALLEVEAEVSGEEGSGDEVEEAEEQSFVDEPQGGGRAMYLRSLRSTPPRPARPLPPLTAEVFSQEPLLDDSYREDSFCVSDGEEVEEEGEDNLDILERRADHLSFGKGRIAVRPSEE